METQIINIQKNSFFDTPNKAYFKIEGFDFFWEMGNHETQLDTLEVRYQDIIMGTLSWTEEEAEEAAKGKNPLEFAIQQAQNLITNQLKKEAKND